MTAPTGTGDTAIVVSGGGSIAVGTAELFEHAQLLDETAARLEWCHRSLASIDRSSAQHLGGSVPFPASAVRAHAHVEDARVAAEDGRQTSAWLAVALRASADAYGHTEDAMTRFTQSLGAAVGMGLGFASTTVGLVMLPDLLAGVAVVGSGYLLAKRIDPAGTRAAMRELGRIVDANAGVVRDPAFVAFVRVAVMSTDDLVGGALHIPPDVLRMLGDEGLGITGTDTVAGGIVVVGSAAGAFRESAVSVTATPAGRSTPAHGLADRASRIPTGETRVRVDRYRMPGEPDRFEVYIAGTSDFSPVSSDDPFDLTSGVAALAGADAGSYRAVQLAMADAGVTADSHVVITGHSQGGLIGAMVAASGDYTVDGLYTVGAPVAQVPVPETVPWVAVEHTDDIVPAIGGNWSSGDAVIVRREAGDGGDSDAVYPAHSARLYEQTGALADATEEARLVDARERLDAVTAGATQVTSTEYTAERVHPDAASG